MSDIQRIGMAKRYSEAAIHNGVIYLAGQVADQSAGADIGAQTAEVLGMVDRLLAQCGSSKEHLLRVEIFLADLADFAKVNAIYAEVFGAGVSPARACVEVAALPKGARVEIDCIALLG